MSIKKRLCLFAGFDANGKIADYVVYFIKALSEYADVYYFGDFDISDKSELAKLEPYCKTAYAKRHSKYDFGSWQELIKIIGRKKISTYDELILTNDSCYGPLYDFGELFTKMEAEPCDFWGLTAAHYRHIHIQSYFVAFKNNILNSDIFYDFFASVKPEKTFQDVCRNYEVNLTYKLAKSGYTFRTLIPYDDLTNSPYFDAERSISEAHFPLLKVKFFLGGIRDQGPVADWRKMLSGTNYPIQLIEQNLLDRGFTLAEIDSNVQNKTREGDYANFNFKHQVKGVAKILLAPFTDLLDRAILRHVAPLKLQCAKLSRRLRELSDQVNKTKKPTDFTIKEGEGLPLRLTKIDTFAANINSESLIPSEDAEILTIGNFSDYNITAFNLESCTTISLNNDWLDSAELLSFSTKHLTDFYFTDHQNQKIFFDLILAQATAADTPAEVVEAFIENLSKQLIYESVLIISAPRKKLKLYKSILEKTGLYPANDSEGLTVEASPYTAYCDKIDTKKGYKVLIYKLKH